MTAFRRTLLVFAGLAGASAGLSAALRPAEVRADEGREDPMREAAALVQLARPEVERGAWTEAIRHLEDARKADPANADAVLLLSSALEQSGAIRKALAALDGFDEVPAVLARRGRLLLDTGDAEGAETVLRAALAKDEGNLPARRLLGRALEETGRRDAAAAEYTEVNRRWARSDEAETDADLLAVARARLGLARVTDEYRIDPAAILSRLEPIVKRADAPVEALVELADLYLVNHQDVDAKRWFKKASERNPHSADAIFGLAKQLAFRYDEEGAQKEAERALRENAEHLPSLLFLAEIALGDGADAKAEELLARALAVNPASAEARGLRAALHYVRGASAEFEAEVRAVLARNKYASAPYRLTAQVLEDQRRFQEAYEMAARAVAADPRDWDAYFLAGRNAMNVGEDAKAEEYLTAAEKGDPFQNIFRTNFLEMYRGLAKFPVVKAGRFVVRLPPAEQEAYGPLVTRAMEESLAALEKKWSFEAEVPIYVSIFDRQEDFAARTTGMPWFPALGACFGRTVTLDSPRALPPGQFGWRATLHHEFSHVITLQLSKGRVPRWLTEGISVYEERKVSPVWNREMERELADALASGEILPLATINNAFRGPRVMFAYYQGGLMCELIERDFGFPALREMVRLFGEGMQTDAVVRKALGVEPAEFDRRFLGYVAEVLADVKVLPRLSQDAMTKLRTRLRKEKDDTQGWLLLATAQAFRGDAAGALASLQNAGTAAAEDGRAAAVRALVAWRQSRPDQAQKHAEDAIAKGCDVFDLRVRLAQQAHAGRDMAKAKEHLRRAIELFPQAPGGDAPRVTLAEMLLGEGESSLEEAMTLLRAHAEVVEDDFQTRLRLATWYRDHGKAEEELRMMREVLDIVPLPNGPWTREASAEFHERLARILLDRKDPAEAERAAAAAAAVAVMDLKREGTPPLDESRRSELVGLHAETLWLLGRTDDARRRAAEALRLDPENADARALVEKLPK